MNLVKTSLLNGIAVMARMLTMLGINKVLAIYVGPSGYAAIGQFQNLLQMITTFSSGALNTGVTKYTAEYGDDTAKQHLIWRTAGTLSVIGSVIAAILIIYFKDFFAVWLLKDSSFSNVFLWLAATITLFTLNTFLYAILNGKKEIKLFVLANISSSIISILVTTILVITLGLYGALIALTIHQSISFFITLSICKRALWFKVKYIFGSIDKKAALNLSKFAAMAVTTAICIPISLICIRNILINDFGQEMAGCWEAMWRLSGAYLLLITSTLGVYYLPKLSELKKTDEIKAEIIQGYKIILPAAATCSLLIYLFRDLIISLLFTKEFSPMEALFAWQMVGDTLKIGSWILAYLMLGKAMTKLFIVSEIFFSGFFVFLTWSLTNLMGFEGVALAHAINYAVYWIIMAIFIARKLYKQQSVSY